MLVSDKGENRRQALKGIGLGLAAGAAAVLSDGRAWPHQRVAALLSAGVRGVERLADLADCDVVLTSLPDDDALSGVALGPTGLAAILTPNAVHISTSTVSPPVSRHVAKEHASHGQDYVAPPVLGSPDFARERKLFVLAARLPPAMLKVVPLLERLGQRVFVIGEEPALANLVKLAANVLHRDDARMHGRGVGLDAKRRG